VGDLYRSLNSSLWDYSHLLRTTADYVWKSRRQLIVWFYSIIFFFISSKYLSQNYAMNHLLSISQNILPADS
jgi:hypothetical protein